MGKDYLIKFCESMKKQPALDMVLKPGLALVYTSGNLEDGVRRRTPHPFFVERSHMFTS